jgi:hypothetical protein
MAAIVCVNDSPSFDALAFALRSAFGGTDAPGLTNDLRGTD